MRIPIREQLSLLLLLSSAIGLCVIAVGSYVTTTKYVYAARKTRLAMSASLKASQLSSSLALMQNSVQFTASRVIVQQELSNYNNNGTADFSGAVPDMAAAIGGPASGGAVGSNLLLQSQIFAAKGDGPAGSTSLINTTNPDILGKVKLPYTHPNGSAVYLGDSGLGFPPQLYPNFTYSDVTASDGQKLSAADYNGLVLSPIDSQALLLGPWAINSSFALLSITIPIINNTSSTNVLGWLSVVMDARLISQIINDPQGLDFSGELLIVRPSNNTNQYRSGITYDDNPDPNVYNSELVEFVLPLNSGDSDRHPNSVYGKPNRAFNMSSFNAVVQAVTVNNDNINNSGSDLKTPNEENYSVAVGYAMVETRSSALASITALRKVILAALFGTLGAMIIVVWPLAHFASRPIRELRTATLKTVMPPGYMVSSESLGEYSDHDDADGNASGDGSAAAIARKEGFFASVLRRQRRPRPDRTDELRRQQFRVPSKVPDRKHIVVDELSELTKTFNEMSDELMMQYERLEERVKQRTAELEVSKKAAEAANESKTLFIANISHELKTPLNGILGMCAVCMQEDDPIRLKRSLGIIYKSGDLLLNLLTDLLTFSKNQVGQQLSLDEKEFHLRDISSQILAIFDKQAREGQINLRVQFMRGDELDTEEVAGDRVKDMVLWGDTHRILQVIINLVSNSLKFTPPQGSVTLNVKCMGDAPEVGSRKTSTGSRATKRLSRSKHSDMSQVGGRPSGSQEGGSVFVDRGNAFQRIMEVDRVAPPPGRMLTFEFEVIDTGPGIPEESHQRIFEPFVQGDLGLSKKYGGTGLGLSICSQLAGLMHGTMAIKSEVGQGSTFSMRIPLRHLLSKADSTASSNASQHGDAASMFSSYSAGDVVGSPRRKSNQGETASIVDPGPPAASPMPDSQQHFDGSQPRLVGLSQPYFATSQPMESPTSQPGAMEQITAAASSSGRIRVLVAEDNKVNQEVVLRMLKLEDIYDVTVAKDGQEALDLVKESMSPPPDSPSKGPFNLIFMDVQMPNLDGLQSTKLIRECGFNAPIVALTAFAEESNVKDCLESGMNYFLSKPIRRPALKKVLKEYCSTIQEVDEDATTPPPLLEKGSQDSAATKGTSKSARRPRTPTTTNIDAQVSFDAADMAAKRRTPTWSIFDLYAISSRSNDYPATPSPSSSFPSLDTDPFFTSS
ncbi:hypothetical protein K461DRAFT_285291 [Myriangium duriaei CBS 260.36]|uniref:histidine kinase n=1 Tax=Myriangium duriaei CBS 260.36 TaxID=1168546 RepID=A0A9P4J574_9PEZI|nr:hypothetical protein K461DRAFT_285291 [Myriangium duriaei CBS 260.36]